MFRNVFVGEAVLEEEIADVSDHAEAEGLLAGNEGEGSSEVLNHQVSGGTHLRLVSFHGEVFHRQFPSRDTGDGDRSFDDRSDDFANRSVDSDTNETTKRVVRGEEGELRVENNEVREGLKSGRDRV